MALTAETLDEAVQPRGNPAGPSVGSEPPVRWLLHRCGTPETGERSTHLDNQSRELVGRELVMPHVAADDLRDPIGIDSISINFDAANPCGIRITADTIYMNPLNYNSRSNTTVAEFSLQTRGGTMHVLHVRDVAVAPNLWLTQLREWRGL